MNRPSLVLILAAASLALAQTPPPSLTLHDAEALAIKNHPQVQAAQLNYQASQQAIAEARAAYYPTLQGDVTGSQGNPQARIGAGYLTDSRVWDRFSQGITLSQLITDSGRTRNLVASSRPAGAGQFATISGHPLRRAAARESGLLPGAAGAGAGDRGE